MGTLLIPATPTELVPRGDGCHDGEVVSLREYLNSMYHPDCDYVDGHLEERNLGELDHTRLQKRIILFFARHEEDWQIEVLQELRLQVSPTNYRVPDIMLLPAGHTTHRIVRQPPIVLIEVLSPEDTFKRLHERVRDYLTLGTQHIWAFDPDTREAFRCDEQGFHKVTQADLTVPNTPIRLELAEVFQVLDKQ